jgi:L-ascorbate metabolism protein UlaG (beta-lactamase superfamily)
MHRTKFGRFITIQAFTIIAILFLAGCSATRPALESATKVVTQTPGLLTSTPGATSTQDYVAPDPEVLSITYVCNDGFIITKGGRKILIDALYQENIGICRSDLAQLAREGLPPFDNADLVLVSHNHSDHFDAQIVGQYLDNTPGAVLVAEKFAMADAMSMSISSFVQAQDRIHSIELGAGQSNSLDIDGIELEIYDAPGDVPNLAFLVRVGGKTLFHTGDVHINTKTTGYFKGYQLSTKMIDVAFFPYFYMMESAEPAFLEYIGAGKYIPMHYAAEGGAVTVRMVGLQFPEAILFTVPLQTWTSND